jgi:hypothetical protein
MGPNGLDEMNIAIATAEAVFQISGKQALCADANVSRSS